MQRRAFGWLYGTGRHARTALRLALVSLGCAAACGAIGVIGAIDAQDASPWRVLEESPDHLLIEINVPVARWVPMQADRGRYAVDGFDLWDEYDGRALPALRLPIAIPPDASVRVRAIVDEDPAPVAELARIDRDPQARDDAADWTSADGIGFVQYRAASLCAGLRVMPLRVHAIWPDDSGRLHAARRIRVSLDFGAGGRETFPAPWPESDVTTETTPAAARHGVRSDAGPMADLVVNRAQGAGWWAGGAAGVRRARADGEDTFGTATSPWLRVSVDRRGVYRLSADDLDAAGIDPGTVDLTQLRLFSGPAGELPDNASPAQLPAWMEPCALYLEDDGDGHWDAATRLYFLANGADGWRTDLGLPETGPADRHFAHAYADHADYWLCWGGEFSTAPRWMDAIEADPGSLPLLTEADDRAHIEENRFYDPRPRQFGGAWPRFFQYSVDANAAGVGASVAVPLADAVTDAGALVRVSLWGASWGVDGLDNDHFARLKVNGETFAEVWWEKVDRRDAVGRLETIAQNNQFSLYVPQRYDAGEKPIGDKVYLDWVEVDYRRRLVASGDSIACFIAGEEAAGHGLRVSGLTRADGWLLLDASTPRDPVRLLPRIVTDGGGYAAEFRVTPQGAQAHLVLVHRDRAASPSRVESVVWPTGWLRERTAPVDYLIVTAPELRPAADALAAYRAGHFHGAAGDTLMPAEVAVVEAQQIFDEFAWGQRDPAALRNFLVHARAAWDDASLGYRLTQVLLLGDAYEDPRNYRRQAARDLVPSFENYEWSQQTSRSWIPSYWGDDYFALLDGPGDTGLDLAIGRLPAGTLPQAQAMVQKTIDNESQPPPGDWKTRLIFAADDICQGNETDGLGFTHMTQTEALIRGGVPPEARIEKVFLYEYGSECRYERKPEATADLLGLFETGALVFNFVGHGSEVQIADERLLDNSSIASLMNTDKPFFMITASCAVGRFTHGGSGLAIQALRMAGRGALAVVSASSTASSAYSHNLNLQLLRRLFAGGELLRPRAFGPTLWQAKTLNAASNDRRYNLLGDPGARLATPRHRLELTLAGVPGVVADADTLIRGGGAQLSGRVVDLRGDPVVDFTGEADVLVLDSDIHRVPTPDMPSRNYSLPGARIFSARVPVTGGEFSCPFFVPTALRTGDRGPARIYAYARAATSGAANDGAGARVSMFIPEKREFSPDDTLGPRIRLLWAQPGTPPRVGSALTATLSDTSGIYVAALAPSRSVVVTITDGNERTLAAQDLAERVVFEGDFRHASVAYEIPAGLPAGEPLTLALEASDNLGRRGRDSVTFTLGAGSEDSGRLLTSVFNIPNPMQLETRFLFQIDRDADIEVTVYTVTGRRVATLRAEQFTPVRAREVGLVWDGRDDDGDVPGNGTYFYLVVARDATGRREERIERLVILR